MTSYHKCVQPSFLSERPEITRRRSEDTVWISHGRCFAILSSSSKVSFGGQVFEVTLFGIRSSAP